MVDTGTSVNLTKVPTLNNFINSDGEQIEAALHQHMITVAMYAATVLPGHRREEKRRREDRSYADCIGRDGVLDFNCRNAPVMMHIDGALGNVQYWCFANFWSF